MGGRDKGERNEKTIFRMAHPPFFFSILTVVGAGDIISMKLS